MYEGMGKEPSGPLRYRSGQRGAHAVIASHLAASHACARARVCMLQVTGLPPGLLSSATRAQRQHRVSGTFSSQSNFGPASSSQAPMAMFRAHTRSSNEFPGTMQVGTPAPLRAYACCRACSARCPLAQQCPRHRGALKEGGQWGSTALPPPHPPHAARSLPPSAYAPRRVVAHPSAEP